MIDRVVETRGATAMNERVGSAKRASVTSPNPATTDKDEADTSAPGSQMALDNSTSGSLEHFTASRPKLSGRTSPSKNPVRDLAARGNNGQFTGNDDTDNETEASEEQAPKSMPAVIQAGAGFRLPSFPAASLKKVDQQKASSTDKDVTGANGDAPRIKLRSVNAGQQSKSSDGATSSPEKSVPEFMGFKLRSTGGAAKLVEPEQQQTTPVYNVQKTQAAVATTKTALGHEKSKQETRPPPFAKQASRGSSDALSSNTANTATDFSTLRKQLKASPRNSRTDLAALASDRSSSRDSLLKGPVPEFAAVRNKLRPLGGAEVSTSGSSLRIDLTGNESASKSVSTNDSKDSKKDQTSPKKLSSLIGRWESAKEPAKSEVGELSSVRSKLKSVGSQNGGSTSTLSGIIAADKTTDEVTVPVASKPTSNASTKEPKFKSEHIETCTTTSMAPVKQVNTTPSKIITPSRYDSSNSNATKLDSAKSVRQYVSPVVGVDESAKLASISLRSTHTDSFISQTGGSLRPSKPLLLLLKGKKRLIPTSVTVQLASLTLTDCFILDMSGSPGVVEDPEKPSTRYLFVCSGPKTPKVRRTKSIETANLIKDLDYSGKAEIFLVDLGDVGDRVQSDKELKFWELLSGQPMRKQQIVEYVAQMKSGDLAEDSEYERAAEASTQLFRFDGRAGEPQVVAADGKALSQTLLQPDACFVLDCKSEAFVWSGRTASDDVKSKALKYAQALSRPVLLQDTQKFERTIFKMKFDNWQNGKELKVYNVLEVKQAGNIKAKDKEWRVYDRGSDMRKTDQLDVQRMYDQSAAVENAIVRNKESTDIDPEELINRDWGFKSLRVWCVQGLAGGDRSAVTPAMIDQMSVKFSSDAPLILYSEECYIFAYDYKEKPSKMNDPVLAARLKITKEELQSQMKENSVIYTWLGEDSRISDQGMTAHIVVDIDARSRSESGSGGGGGKPKARQVRVQEGKEPEHFLNMIRGGNLPKDQPQNILDLLTAAPSPPCPVVIVRRGTRKTASTKANAVYHVMGSTKEVVRVTQLQQCSAQHLSSGHSYVLVDGANSAVYVWHGVGSFAWERQAAAESAKIFAKESSSKIIAVEEGQESSAFVAAFDSPKGSADQEPCWKNKAALQSIRSRASDAPLASTQNSAASIAPYAVRLWRILSFVNGVPTAAEISPFRQRDLLDDGVYILDCYFELFVWIGSEVGRWTKPASVSVPSSPIPTEDNLSAKSMSSGFKDLRLALDTALRYADYVSQRDTGRLEKSKGLVVQSGLEPKFFKSHFWHWTERYDDSQRAKITWPTGLAVEEAVRRIEKVKYVSREVRAWAANKDLIPFGVDPEHLENHVTEQDFAAAFGMDQAKFAALPLWRQIELKKKSGLF